MKKSAENKLPIMEANAREIHVIEFLAGLDAQLIKGQGILKDRLALIPDGWRKFRLAVSTTEKVLDSVYETLPTRTLKHMDRLCQYGEIIIRPKPMIKMPDDVQIVTSEDLRMLINKVIAAECAVCLKNQSEQKGCKLRKALQNVAPTAEVYHNGLCSYVDVAAAHELGDYI